MADRKEELNKGRGDKERRGIPVVEETMHIGKRVIKTGSVRIIKKVDEETVEVPSAVRKTSYSIEHVPLNQYVEKAPPAVRHEGNTMILSVVEEEVVLLKRLKVVEELRITLNETEKTTTTEVVLKKERVSIERDQANLNEK